MARDDREAREGVTLGPSVEFGLEAFSEGGDGSRGELGTRRSPPRPGSSKWPGLLADGAPLTNEVSRVVAARATRPDHAIMRSATRFASRGATRSHGTHLGPRMHLSFGQPIEAARPRQGARLARINQP